MNVVDLDALEQRFQPYRATNGNAYGGDGDVLTLIAEVREYRANPVTQEWLADHDSVLISAAEWEAARKVVETARTHRHIEGRPQAAINMAGKCAVCTALAEYEALK